MTTPTSPVTLSRESMCPCAGACHHDTSPCSLGCWAAQKPWRVEEAREEGRAEAASRAVTETPEGLDLTLRAINRSMDEFVSLTWTEDEYRAAIRAWQRSIRTALAHKEEHGG